MQWIFRRTHAAALVACVGLLAASAGAQSAESQPVPEQETSADQPARTDRIGRGEGPRMDGSGPHGPTRRSGDDRGPMGRVQGPRDMRMLDLREMGAELPPMPPPRARGLGGEGGPRSPFAEAPAADLPSGDDRVMDLVRALAAPLDLMAWEVAPGIVMVAGSAEAHDKLQSLLDQMTGLFAARFEVELVAASFPAAQAPALGAEVAGGKTIARSRQRVAAGAPVEVNATDLVTYIADWVPIVADSAVAYQPTRAQVANGLRCSLVLHPSAGQGSGIEGLKVGVNGEISAANIVEKSWEIAMPNAKTSLTVGLPRVAVRSIDSTGPATARPTAVTIVPGFDPGEVLVIGVGVQPAASPAGK